MLKNIDLYIFFKLTYFQNRRNELHIEKEGTVLRIKKTESLAIFKSNKIMCAFNLIV